MALTEKNQVHPTYWLPRLSPVIKTKLLCFIINSVVRYTSTVHIQYVVRVLHGGKELAHKNLSSHSVFCLMILPHPQDIHLKDRQYVVNVNI
jgi:hypothetical protein